MEGKKLTYATLHGVIHITDVGQYGPVLSSTGTGSHKPVSMTQLDGQVLVEVPYPGNPNKKAVLLIDNSGFTYRRLEDK